MKERPRADLAAVVDAIRGPFGEHGLSYVQLPEACEGEEIAVVTLLMHISGQWISSRTVVPVTKKDAQGYGSALTYARRYGLQAMAGVAAEDDDGNAAASASPKALPKRGRLPVVPALYSRAPKGYPNPFTMKLGGIEFDDKLSSSRRNIVNALFDQIITFRHAELKAAWKAIYAAEAVTPKVRPRAEGHSLDLGAAELAEARRQASAVPLDGKLAADKAFNQAFKDKADVKSRLETEWDSAAKSNYAKAIDRADQAARMR